MKKGLLHQGHVVWPCASTAPQRRQAVPARRHSASFEGNPVSLEDRVDRGLGRHNLELLRSDRLRGHKLQKANKHGFSSRMSSIGEQPSANIWTAPRLEHETKPPQISSESG